jgi:hypothetical protein
MVPGGRSFYELLRARTGTKFSTGTSRGTKFSARVLHQHGMQAVVLRSCRSTVGRGRAVEAAKSCGNTAVRVLSNLLQE